MTRATNQPGAFLTLGPTGAAPKQPANLPPEVAVTPPPPAENANASLQANDLHATGQPANGPTSAVIPPAAAPSAAQNLTAQLLSVDPNMTLNQLTGTLNILAPNRHMRTVASSLLRSSQPGSRPPAAVSNVL